MGTDHAIVIAWGFRVPLKLWNEFRKKVHANWKEQQRLYWKKRKTEDSYSPDEEGSYYSEDDAHHLDVETDFNKITDPGSDANFEFFSQAAYATNDVNLYVLIAKKGQGFEYLMDRKIGGAMMGMFKCEFEHMQNISSLEFSVDLEDGPELCKDWKNNGMYNLNSC